MNYEDREMMGKYLRQNIASKPKKWLIYLSLQPTNSSIYQVQVTVKWAGWWVMSQDRSYRPNLGKAQVARCPMPLAAEWAHDWLGLSWMSGQAVKGEVCWRGSHVSAKLTSLATWHRSRNSREENLAFLKIGLRPETSKLIQSSFKNRKRTTISPSKEKQIKSWFGHMAHHMQPASVAFGNRHAWHETMKQLFMTS